MQVGSGSVTAYVTDACKELVGQLKSAEQQLTVDVSKVAGCSAHLTQLHKIADLGHKHVLLLATLRARAMSPRSIDRVSRRFVVRRISLHHFATNHHKSPCINHAEFPVTRSIPPH